MGGWENPSRLQKCKAHVPTNSVIQQLYPDSGTPGSRVFSLLFPQNRVTHKVPSLPHTSLSSTYVSLFLSSHLSLSGERSQGGG